ncbi:MAG: nonstructural protein [Microvirus sp.]|nr:MAG: nonstructural protein [Microvirus sp.]
MNLYVFSFLDTKTGYFSTPFFMPHRGQAIRAAIDIGQDPNTTVGRHPADFILCEVACFDDQTGAFLNGPVTQLGTVLSLSPAPATQLPLLQRAAE